ncbi:MAG TPA: hypothetical protein VFH58_05590 [Acidimicrobiales bacterium]|nr:hypothetical protein [Acidimicrobiales bacterium]
MAALYVIAGGRVVQAYSLADLNRMRCAQLKRDRQARAVDRNGARRVRLALREARLDHQNAVRRAKLAEGRRRSRYKEMERRLSHQAMLRRREARWHPRPARSGR